MINKALWIAPAGAENLKPCWFLARRKVTFNAVPESLPLQITCDGNYLLEINGMTIGRGPARGNRQTAFFDQYETAKYFHPGENTISILSICMNINAMSTFPITPAVRMALGDILVTDLEWETYLCTAEFPTGGPSFTRQSGFAEWRNLNFDHHITLPERAQTIEVAADSPLQKKNLCRRDVPMPLETIVLPADIPAAALVPPADLSRTDFAKLNTAEEHLPLPEDAGKIFAALLNETDVALPLPESNGGVTFVIDFAKEVSGRVEIELTAPAGSVADIVYEEELYQGDRLRADHTHTSPDYQFCDRNVLRSGRQTVGNLIMERGFRMVQLTLRNLTAPVVIHSIKAVDVRYPFAPRGQFFCSDYQLNRLWETAKETISACTTDIFTDCPWRERLFYCNDMVIENRTALKIFGDPAIHKRAFRMVFSQKRSDGLFTSISPSTLGDIPDGATNFNVILSGNLTLTMSVLDYYMHTGDLDMVKEALPPLRKMLMTFKSWKDDKGILHPPLKYWNFIDWSFELNGMAFSGKATSLLNFLYIISCKAFLKLADYAGEEPVESAAGLQKILDGSISEFYSPEKERFINTTADPAASFDELIKLGVPPEKDFPVSNFSRLAQAMALIAGADKKLCSGIADESLLVPELYYGIFLLDGYEILQDTDGALAYIRKHWGSMLDSGTPTLWENGVHKIGKAGFGGSASLCHGFSSSPAAFLQSVILGVAPTAPGFREFKFAPVTADVKFASGNVPTPCGSIRAKWQKEGNLITATLHVPAGCTAHTPAGTFTAGAHSFSWHADRLD